MSFSGRRRRVPLVVLAILVPAALCLGVGVFQATRADRDRRDAAARDRMTRALADTAASMAREAESAVQVAADAGRRRLAEGATPVPTAPDGPLVVLWDASRRRISPPARGVVLEDDLLEGDAAAPRLQRAGSLFRQAPEAGRDALEELTTRTGSAVVEAAATVRLARDAIESGRESEGLERLATLGVPGADLLGTAARWWVVTTSLDHALLEQDGPRIDRLVRSSTEILEELAGAGDLLAETLEPELLARLGRHEALAGAVRQRLSAARRARSRLVDLGITGPPDVSGLAWNQAIRRLHGARYVAVVRVADEAGNFAGIVLVVPDFPEPEGATVRAIGAPSSPETLTVPLVGYLAGHRLDAPVPAERALSWRPGAVTAAFLLVCLLTAGWGAHVVWRGIRRDEQAIDARSELLNRVSHQLKTPVANLRLFAETLASGAVDDPAERQRMERILGMESERLGEHLQRLLSLARLDATDGSERELVALAPLLDELVDRWRSAAAVKGRSVRRQGEVTATLRADRPALVDALHNVVDNALRHAPEGGTVEVRVGGGDAGIVIEVVDGGPGFAAGEVERVFERFQRGASDLGEGTGLGLALAREGARRAGGTLEVAETGPEGTTMRFRLPSVEGG